DLAEAPDQRVFRGHAGVRAWIAKLQEAWGEGFVRFEPQSIVEGDGAVVVDTRAKAVGGGSPNPRRKLPCRGWAGYLPPPLAGRCRRFAGRVQAIAAFP